MPRPGDPAPAPVLGMAAAAAAPGGGLPCAEAGGGASARTKATPMEARLRCAFSFSALFAGDDDAKLSDLPFYTLIVRRSRDVVNGSGSWREIAIAGCASSDGRSFI